MTPLIAQILLENAGKHEYGCLMADLIINWPAVQKLVQEDDLYTDGDGHGREQDPHCTVLYGLHDGVDLKRIREYIRDNFPHGISMDLIDISIFEKDDCDVVKFGVSSLALVNVNGWLRETFPHTSSFPDYKPHVTIAYVKKGRGKKYVKKLKEPYAVISKMMNYSLPSGQQLHFPV